MHPVASKISLKSFEGRLEVLGKGTDVSYVDSLEGEQSALVVRGLTAAEAWEALSRLHGPVVVANTGNAQSEAKPAKAEKPKTDKKEPEQTDLPKTEAKAEPKKQEPKAEVKKPEPPPIDIDVDDLADDPKAQDWNGIDVEFLKKQDKLRPVIEHLRDHGFDTVEKVIEISKSLKATVPALQAVEAKGGFEQRMERNAMVVLAKEGAAS